MINKTESNESVMCSSLADTLKAQTNDKRYKNKDTNTKKQGDKK
jgi:hypothetical protein